MWKQQERKTVVTSLGPAVLAMLVLAHVTLLCAGQDVGANSTGAASTTASPALSKRPLRLPNATFPLHYHLHIVTNIHRGDLTYEGNVTIDIETRQSTNEIVLHAKNLSNFATTVYDLGSATRMPDLTHSYDAEASFLIIHAVEYYQVFEAGRKYRVEILYEGRMHEKTGIYWLTYKDSNNRTVYHAATQFEPTSARLALPCYDEPAFKANFTIRITHSNSYMAISNMQVKHVHRHASDDLATTTFHPTPPISTYLVAFVISNFDYIAEEFRGVTQRIYTPPDATDKGHLALKNAVRTVATIEDYFGVSYPLRKLDHVALNKNYGTAMENWGLITYREDHLLYQDTGGPYKKLKDTLTQVHEIAHQWFGNLVSPDWWSFAWLNEGFATYFSYIITDLLYPEHRTMDFFMIDIAERAYSYSYINVRPMTHYVEKESEITSIFDIISYQRAACIIKMFHHAFNQKTFVRGINRFLTKYQYTVANEIDLFDCLQAAVAEDKTLNGRAWAKSVRSIMLSWTHSEWIPIVTVIRNYENNTVTIRQRSNNAQFQEHWWIPLNFASASDNEFERTSADYFMPPLQEITLNAAQMGIDLHRHDWLIVNKQQTGFYHVLYDDDNLLAIAKTLQENHTAIHELNRVAIFQDLRSLIENSEIQSVSVIFELLKYLHREENLLIWNFVADTVEFLEKNLHGTDAHYHYKRFVRRLIAPIFRKLFRESQTFNMTSTESLAHQKIIDMACMVDLPECLEYTRRLAHNYIFHNVKLETDYYDYYVMLDSLLCFGFKYLSDGEFNATLQLLSQSEHDPMWYEDLIYALRCTQNRAHLRQYLNLMLANNATHMALNNSESMTYLLYLYTANLAARPVVWQFFERNYRLLCRSPAFVENFNRIAEYVPKQHLKQFRALHDRIASELQSPDGSRADRLIRLDSHRIGKKTRIRESFLSKFESDIHEWLLREQAPSIYAASVGGRSAAASRYGTVLRMASHILRTVLKATH